MAVRSILRFPDPRLRQPTVEVDPAAIGDDLRALVADLIETMYAADGAGLAATQIGADRRVFVVDAKAAGRDPTEPPLVFLNPRLAELSREKETAEEGCLSFPGIFVPLKRSLRVRVSAFGMDGQQFEVAGDGLFGRALQHEMDHLDGRLLIDHVGPVKRELIKRRLRREAEEAAEARE
jgi:peptide deformylase